jgi:small-conductance mechanosensitive channel
MCDNFLKVMNNQQPAITSVLNQAVANRISINRQMLSSIIQTVILCGRQNISLRGHFDNITDVEKDITQSSNHGNFWALLNFRIAAGDVVLHDHLTNSLLNARYRSFSKILALIVQCSEFLRRIFRDKTEVFCSA